MKERNLKRIVLLSIAVLLVFSIVGCTKEKEGIIAEVNGIEITKEEFDNDFEYFKNIYEREYGEDALQQKGQEGKTIEEMLKENVLEKLILEKLIEDESKALNIQVSDEEIEERIEENAIQVGGREKFDEFLESNNITKEFYSDFAKKQIMIDKYRIQLINNINIPEDEAMAFYESNKDNLTLIKVSHILVSNEEEGNKILERLKNGEDFAALATLESLHSISAAQGGDLGYIRRGQMITEFEDKAFSMEIGEISNLVKTDVGYHIIYLKDKKDTYDELKLDIFDILKEQEYINKISELRNKAKVKNYMENK